MPRSLLTPRWIILHVAVVLVVATCVAAGVWQLDRLEQRRTFNASVREGLAAPVVSLEELEPVDGPSEAADYRRVTARGTYDPSHELLLYGRSLDGRPGHHVLTPLVLEDGRAVLVDRGWVPFELDTPPVVDAAPPAGRVEVAGVLFPTQPGEDSRDRVVRRVDVAAIDERVPHSLLPRFLLLQTQEPATASRFPTSAPLPELTDGPHLSYAVQWFLFASVAIVVYGALLRRDLRDRRRGSGENEPAAAASAR